jgi:paraquat-inducible protein A
VALRGRPELIACDDCDALYRRPVLAPREQARCQRCGNLLARGHRLSDSALLALAVTALVVLLIANTQPLVELNLRGLRNSATLPGALVDTWMDGEPLVAPWIALIAGAAGFAFPIAAVLLRLYALLPVALGRLPAGWAQAVRALHAVERWSMVEVLLLAALVSIVRIAGLARVVPGVGLAAFLVLALLLAALQAAGQHRLWQVGEQVRPREGRA